MTLSDHIKNKVFAPRLEQNQALVIYDAASRYKEIVKGMASEGVTVVDASDSIVEARETAMEALVARGQRPEKAPSVLVYVPAEVPADEDAMCADFFSAIAAAGDVFPQGDGDSYLNLCLGANPDYASKIRELFASGEPSFDAVDAVGVGGGQFPRLKTELGCESNAEILMTLMVPSDDQLVHLKRGGSCRKESLSFLKQALSFTPKESTASWSVIQKDLWRLVLFSEFVFDLPTELPESLSKVETAPGEAQDLVYRACFSLRDSERTRLTYIEQSEVIMVDLDLESEMVDVRDLGERDTFSFEERSFFSGYIDAVRADDIAKAEAIATDRKNSVWVKESDRQLLWTLAERALELLRGVADFERELKEIKTNSAELITFYTGRGYRLDQRYRYFEETFSEISEDSEDIDNLVAECRRRYRECVDRLQRIFMTAVRQSGWPVEGIRPAASLFDERVKPLMGEPNAKVAVLWIDALRYELAVALNEALSDYEKTDLRTVCGALPSITPVGMASLLPDAREMKLKMKAGKLVPHFGDGAVATAQERVSVLSAEYGDRFMDIRLDDLINKRFTKPFKEQFENKALTLVRYQRIDSEGENYAPDLFANLKRHVDNILKAVRRLAELGYADIFLFTDHGFLVFPEHEAGNKATKPEGTWMLEKERVLVGSAGENTETIRFTADELGVAGDAEHLVFPKTLATFSEGVQYFHGGLSIQECVIPDLHVRSNKVADVAEPKWDLRLSYRGKASGAVTTRRPMIEIAAFTEDMFEQDIAFNLIARSAEGEVVGTAASSDYTDKNTGYVALPTGKTAKIPLRLSEEFSGEFEVRAQDPDTGKFFGNTVKLVTQILE